VTGRNRESLNLCPLSAVNIVPFETTGARNGTPFFHLLQHSRNHWDKIYHINFTSDFSSLCQSSQLVRHAVVGIAACHLRHFTPNNLHHRTAEYFYQSLALYDYRQRTRESLHEVQPSEISELLLSGALLHVLAFPLPSLEQNGSDTSPFLHSGSGDTIGWLILQAGLRLVLRSAGEYLHNAMDVLGPIFLGTRVTNHMMRTEGLESVPKLWIPFFDLAPRGSYAPQSQHVHEVGVAAARPIIGSVPDTSWEAVVAPLIQASRLRYLQPIPSNIFHHFAFLAKMHPRFRLLLRRRDRRAMWLYGFWSGLMCRFENLWWAKDRSRRNHRAIISWFRKSRVTIPVGEEAFLWDRMISELEEAPDLSQTQIK
jgi:hypothetical protein